MEENGVVTVAINHISRMGEFSTPSVNRPEARLLQSNGFATVRGEESARQSPEPTGIAVAEVEIISEEVEVGSFLLMQCRACVRVGDAFVEASSNHHHAPWHGDDRHPRHDPVADRDGHAWDLAILPAQSVRQSSGCLPSSVLVPMSPRSIARHRYRSTIRPWRLDVTAGHPGRLPLRPQPDDHRTVFRPARGGRFWWRLQCWVCLPRVIINIIYIPL